MKKRPKLELGKILDILYEIKDDVFYFKEYGKDLISSYIKQEQDKNKYSEEEVKLIEYIQWVIRKIDAGNTPEEIVRLLLFNRDKIEQFKKK
jgi:hypothetical protein